MTLEERFKKVMFWPNGRIIMGGCGSRCYMFKNVIDLLFEYKDKAEKAENTLKVILEYITEVIEEKDKDNAKRY